MASAYVRLSINRSYKTRYVKKKAKGQGIYAYQLPGMPSGIHAPGLKDLCCCGRCSMKTV